MVTDNDSSLDVSSTSAPPLGNWLLSWRLQTLSPPKLYCNARQQVEVAVTLEPRSNTVITDEELRSLKLVVRRDDGSFSDIPMNDAPDTLWFASDRQNEYQYYPELLILIPVADDGGPVPGVVRTKRFYVHTRARAGEQLEIWASITHDVPEGMKYEYISDGSQVGFNSSITLSSVNIPSYNVPADYTFERRLVGGQDNSDLFIWEYDLAPAHVQYPNAPLLSAEVVPKGMIQWATNSSSQTRAGHAGFAVPGDATIHYNDAIELGPAFVPVAQTKVIPQGSVTVVLQGGNNIPFHFTSASTHKGPMVIRAIDHYGNDHVLSVKFENGFPAGRTNLVLSRA